MPAPAFALVGATLLPSAPARNVEELCGRISRQENADAGDGAADVHVAALNVNAKQRPLVLLHLAPTKGGAGDDVDARRNELLAIIQPHVDLRDPYGSGQTVKAVRAWRAPPNAESKAQLVEVPIKSLAQALQPRRASGALPDVAAADEQDATGSGRDPDADDALDDPDGAVDCWDVVAPVPGESGADASEATDARLERLQRALTSAQTKMARQLANLKRSNPLAPTDFAPHPFWGPRLGLSASQAGGGRASPLPVPDKDLVTPYDDCGATMVGPVGQQGLKLYFDHGALAGWVEQSSPCCAAAAVAGAWNAVKPAATMLFPDGTPKLGQEDVLELYREHWGQEVASAEKQVLNLLAAQLGALDAAEADASGHLVPAPPPGLASLDQLAAHFRNDGILKRGTKPGRNAVEASLCKFADVDRAQVQAAEQQEQAAPPKEKPASARRPGSARKPSGKKRATKKKARGRTDVPVEIFEGARPPQAGPSSGAVPVEEAGQGEEQPDGASGGESGADSSDISSLVVEGRQQRTSVRSRPASAAPGRGVRDPEGQLKPAVAAALLGGARATLVARVATWATKSNALEKLSPPQPSTAPVGTDRVLWALSTLGNRNQVGLNVWRLLGAGRGRWEMSLSEKDTTTDVARQWLRCVELLQRTGAALVFHLENHYSLIHAAREWQADAGYGGRRTVRQLLVARPGQRPCYWYDFEWLRSTLLAWKGYGVVAVECAQTQLAAADAEHGGPLETSFSVPPAISEDRRQALAAHMSSRATRAAATRTSAPGGPSEEAAPWRPKKAASALPVPVPKTHSEREVRIHALRARAKTLSVMVMPAKAGDGRVLTKDGTVVMTDGSTVPMMGPSPRATAEELRNLPLPQLPQMTTVPSLPCHEIDFLEDAIDEGSDREAAFSISDHSDSGSDLAGL
ncbi:unnamed protein product [Pedinophyceae sp. YPF-701]|nr:unnamed protein product [Pedinophyceae sp. YPF-701]